jgi:hypothetical protein
MFPKILSDIISVQLSMAISSKYFVYNICFNRASYMTDLSYMTMLRKYYNKVIHWRTDFRLRFIYWNFTMMIIIECFNKWQIK